MNIIFRIFKSLNAVEKTALFIASPFILLQLISCIPFIAIFFIEKGFNKLFLKDSS